MTAQKFFVNFHQVRVVKVGGRPQTPPCAFLGADDGFQFIVTKAVVADKVNALNFRFLTFFNFKNHVHTVLIPLNNLRVHLGQEETFLAVISQNALHVLLNFGRCVNTTRLKGDDITEAFFHHFFVAFKRHFVDQWVFFHLNGQLAVVKRNFHMVKQPCVVKVFNNAAALRRVIIFPRRNVDVT